MVVELLNSVVILLILRFLAIFPNLLYFTRTKLPRFIYLMVGWFIWAGSLLFHIFQEEVNTFDFFYALGSYIGTYLVVSGIVQSFTKNSWKIPNILALSASILYFVLYLIAPGLIFIVLTIIQAFLIFGGLSLGIMYHKLIKERGGLTSQFWFFLLAVISVNQIILFIFVPEFANSQIAYGINYLIIFVINFFIISVEDNIILNQIAQVNQELIEKENQINGIIQTSEDLFFELDKDGNYTYINDRVEKILGYSPKEVIGLKSGTRLNLESEERQKLFKPILDAIKAKKTIRNLEHLNYHKDGHPVVLSTTLIPDLDENGNIIRIRGFSRDITEFKNIQKKLIASEKMEAIGRFAGGIAHDFNNLLTIINGLSEEIVEYSSELVNSLEKIPASLNNNQMTIDKELFDRICDEIQCWNKDASEIFESGIRAANLTRQLLAFSRKQIMNPQIINPSDIIRRSTNMLKRLIREDIRLDFEIADGIGNIYCDPNQIERVLVNLVLNARDAINTMNSMNSIKNKDGNIKITVKQISEVEFMAKEKKYDNVSQSVNNQSLNYHPANFVEISVSDNGMGIKKEQLSHLFEPFYTTKETGKGTGLGLSTVYGIVKQSNGEITVDSVEGEGTTFKIYFPITDKLPEKEKYTLGQGRSKANNLHGTEAILVVEDEVDLLHFIESKLKEHGYSVYAINNPKDAIEKFSGRDPHFDLLITDIIMPGISGASLADQIGKSRPNLRVLFISGYSEDIISEKGVLKEGINFLPKPFSARELLEKVRTILDLI